MAAAICAANGALGESSTARYPRDPDGPCPMDGSGGFEGVIYGLTMGLAGGLAPPNALGTATFPIGTGGAVWTRGDCAAALAAMAASGVEARRVEGGQ